QPSELAVRYLLRDERHDENVARSRRRQRNLVGLAGGGYERSLERADHRDRAIGERRDARYARPTASVHALPPGEPAFGRVARHEHTSDTAGSHKRLGALARTEGRWSGQESCDDEGSVTESGHGVRLGARRAGTAAHPLKLPVRVVLRHEQISVEYRTRGVR